MRNHSHRLWAIVAGFAVAMTAAVALFALDEREAAHTAAGVAGTLAIALADAARVLARNGRTSLPPPP